MKKMRSRWWSANNDLLNEDAVYLEFVEYDASGNKRYAVGNFDIHITMPSYLFVNELKSRRTGDPTISASNDYFSDRCCCTS